MKCNDTPQHFKELSARTVSVQQYAINANIRIYMYCAIGLYIAPLAQLYIKPFTLTSAKVINIFGNTMQVHSVTIWIELTNVNILHSFRVFALLENFATLKSFHLVFFPCFVLFLFLSLFVLWYCFYCYCCSLNNHFFCRFSTRERISKEEREKEK